jgi:hypothetical protein
MEWSRRRWKISAAVDPIEANALRGGHISLRDSIVVFQESLKKISKPTEPFAPARICIRQDSARSGCFGRDPPGKELR